LNYARAFKHLARFSKSARHRSGTAIFRASKQ